MAMEFKVGDLVAAEKWTINGNIDSLGMIVDRSTSSWKIEWYGFDVENTWYTRDDIRAFRANYMRLKKKLDL